MNHPSPFLNGIVIVAVLNISGCATFCSLSDTGMGRPGPYSGIRSTATDWEGRVKPWDVDYPNWMRMPVQLYFRTIDVPLSLIADTLLLHVTMLTMIEPPPR